MTYPQPDSNTPVLKGESLFRLKTTMQTVLDIYESQQSGYAFAVGPDSDFARYTVAYFDENNPPTYMSTFEISPSRPYVSSIPIIARNEPGTVYQPSGRQGRILFYPSDNWDPWYRPTGADVNDLFIIPTPVIDVMEFFSSPQGIIPPRADRKYYFQTLNCPDGQSAYYVFPTYGRQYSFVSFTNRSGGAITYEVRGVNLSYEYTLLSTPELGTPHAAETTIVASGSVADNAQVNKSVNAMGGVEGIYDLLVVKFTNGGAGALLGAKMVFSVLTSDLPH